MAARSSVLQYTALYCGWKGYKRQGCIAIQPGVLWQATGLPVSQGRQPCRDTALGRGAGHAAGGRAGRSAGRGAQGARQAGAWHGRCARGQARPGSAAGQRAVHSVHSACFWPGLTQYCS